MGVDIPFKRPRPAPEWLAAIAGGSGAKRPGSGKPGPPALSPYLAAKVLVPLCELNLAELLSESADGGKSVSGIARARLQTSGFETSICFVRGELGFEEMVVILPEGVVSWPVRQLTPSAADFLSVQAL